MLDSSPNPKAPSTDRAAAHGNDSMPPRSASVDSHQLLRGRRELVIDHSGQQYRLRLTRNDKLILTK